MQEMQKQLASLQGEVIRWTGIIRREHFDGYYTHVESIRSSDICINDTERRIVVCDACITESASILTAASIKCLGDKKSYLVRGKSDKNLNIITWISPQKTPPLAHGSQDMSPWKVRFQNGSGDEVDSGMYLILDVSLFPCYMHMVLAEYE